MEEKFNLTKGSILNKLLVIALPIMGTQLLQMAYNLTDMYWLGNVSSEAVAASGTAGMYLWLSMAFLMIGRMGSEIGVSQNLGRGDTKSARKFSGNSLFLAVILGLIYGGVLVLFNKPLIGFFNLQEADVASMAQQYLLITGIGIPFTFISGSINGVFTGAGNSKLPFYINAVGLCFNMILDPLFIIVFNLGVVGAALATIIGQIIVCIIFMIAIKWYKQRPFMDFSYRKVFKPKKEIIDKIIKWSLPICLESLLFTFLSMVISRMIAGYDAGAIAAQKIGSQIESLSWLIGGGFASALTAFVGQNYGAKKWKRIHEGFKISAKVLIGWGLFVTAGLYFGATVLFKVFLDDPAVLPIGEQYLRILAVSQLFICLEALAAGAFRGIGKTIPPSIVSVSINVIRIPIAYYLSLTSLGLNGIWWGLSIGGILKGVLLIIWYLFYIRKQPKEDLVVEN